jgi:hypothetical protein
MAQKTHRSSFGSRSDLSTDYGLIATAVAATLLALVYLILI